MTPTREQLIEDIAGKLWRDLCEGEGQHSEALDKSLIRKHMDRLAACLAAPPPQVIIDCKVFPDESEPFRAPEPRVMPPIEPGDWFMIAVNAPVNVKNAGHARALKAPNRRNAIREIRKANGTVWTREPRR